MSRRKADSGQSEPTPTTWQGNTLCAAMSGLLIYQVTLRVSTDDHTDQPELELLDCFSASSIDSKTHVIQGLSHHPCCDCSANADQPHGGC
ncbi:hypothetical protein BDV11DRAFT_189125 [Aspergillus similis]